MKFVVSSSNLLTHLQAINRVINNKNTLPILDNFLFQITGNTLTVTASDLETTMITSLDIDSQGNDGAVAVAAKFVSDILRGFSDQPLTFEVDSNYHMVITSANGKYEMGGQNGDEYPEQPLLQDGPVRSFTIAVKDLERSIVKTIFATADDELRPVMNGIFVDISEECVTFAASDAHKLVRIKNLHVFGSEPSSFILPKKPASLLKNILGKEEGNVFVEFDNKNACFSLNRYKMFCRQIEGRYPNYASVIPQNNINRLVSDRSSAIASLNRVSVCSNAASNLIRMDIDIDMVRVSAQDLDFSISANENIPCQYNGEPMAIGFKSSFLIELLSNIDSEEVLFELADSSRAALIKPFEQDTEQDVLMLIMPMMVSE